MRNRKEICELSEAIQNLPPELREKIYKDCHHKALPASGFVLGQGPRAYFKTAFLPIQPADCTNDNLF